MSIRFSAVEKFLVGWEFNIFYAQFLLKSYAIVRYFCEMRDQISGFPRPFHICLTDFSCMHHICKT